jgi:hypothetical protein
MDDIVNLLSATCNSRRNLINLYEAWGKPEKAEQWREELPQTETIEE